MSAQNKKTTFIHLGSVDYKEAWEYQEKLFSEVVETKIANRKRSPENQLSTPNFLLFCYHPHVFTLGKSGKERHLLLDKYGLDDKEAQFYKINRGGDITYHGPGQIVGYPILDLDNFFTDIHKYLRFLEEAVILTLGDYQLKGDRISGLTGVWLDADDPANARKICAMGVKSSRWVTMHGFAFNVQVDLSYFNYIVPCGINDKKVTSLDQELGYAPDITEVETKLRNYLASLFQMELYE